MAPREPRAAPHADTETLEVKSERALRSEEPRSLLRLVHPADLAQALPLVPPMELGREQLPHGSVSRRHLLVERQQHGLLVSDPGSKNGAWLDGEPLGSTPRPLSDQAVLRLGGVVLVHDLLGPHSQVETPGLLEALPGQSSALVALRALVARAARDPSSALILGETGVGKERVAQALHRHSGRPGPFVAVNVAELSERLIESQLFGHVKGAFTGADAAQPGLFRSAHRGTLLLDEIGELPLELQAKLLRVLQEREVRPVGATRAEPIDVRVVAATHRDLAQDVEAGRFRRDLYARLRLFELRVPSLAARRADILLMLDRLYARWLAERGHPERPLHLEPDAVEALLLAPHRENLRSLDRLVHTLGIPRRPVLGLADLSPHLERPLAAEAARPDPAQPTPAVTPPRSAEELRAAFEREGSVRALAKYFGKDRKQIYRWLDQFGLRSLVAHEGDP